MQDYSDCDTIIDTLFVTNAPKLTYKDRYAPHDEGDRITLLNERLVDAPTDINKERVVCEQQAVPVPYPY